ncbi:hypothetical protein Enr13x_09790 [Stieleria neptunia]|uniref:Bacterial Ig-like domain (Group 2) n=1 Tax=Stieleria neptunia TaxID=2527979 RepID=A0A518HJY7_9BACT|nr:DUF1549 and DUF1553 domain-containing protein [Stieleria neptunia]QDV41141.1 hypothetical protein Enr13x_09790 [Stieleria neptunia]
MTAIRFILLLALASPLGEAAEPSSTVNYQRHISPLFSKFGCNAGACHGAAEGQGGFKLSLFGFDAAADYQAIIDQDAERVAKSPDQSLLLLKPSGNLDHEGGTRFNVDSPSYELVKRWIREGAKNEVLGALVELSIVPAQVNLSSTTPEADFKVVARFADDSRLDVTNVSKLHVLDDSLAKVDTSGRLTRIGNGDTSIIATYGGRSASAAVLLVDDPENTLRLEPPANEVDEWINRKLVRLQISPAEKTDDYAFLRRLYLIATGRLPTPIEIQSFVADSSGDKRSRAIDRVLVSPQHASLWATRMCEITGSREHLSSDAAVAEKQQRRWHEWFRIRFADNTPYDQIARSVLTATSRDRHAVGEFIRRCAETPTDVALDAASYAAKPTLDLYWARREANERVNLESLSERTAAAFLGVRMECARCHKHPFDRWTQNDHRSFANVFAQIRYGLSPELRSGLANALEERRASIAAGESPLRIPRIREVYVTDNRSANFRDATTMEVLKPRPLGGAPFEPEGDRREQFVQWLLQPDNPFFARNIVNRVWAFYFGRGITEPVDAFSASNPPSHPELLDWLEKDFVASGYDIRRLERMILNSNAWQRAATIATDRRNNSRNYSRFQVRILPAAVIVDAIADVAGDSDQRAVESPLFRPKTSGATEYFQVFDRPERVATCDCERSDAPSLRQTMLLLSDDTLLERLRKGIAEDFTHIRRDRKRVRQLFFTTLSRPPTRDERKTAMEYLSESEDRVEAVVDLAWSLVTTREFFTNH